VPEQVVMDAQRALLVQNLLLCWRYSVGNAYEEFSYPESPDVAQVMGEEGFADVERAILELSFTRRPTPFPDWNRGERLLVSAAHVRRFRDVAFLRRATPTLAQFVAALGRDLSGGKAALLGPERYSADIPDLVRAFHGQAVAWAGLRAIASVWAGNGYAYSPRRRTALRSGSSSACGTPSAARSAGLRTARSSSRRACSATSGPTGRSSRRAWAATGTS
jgi:hypothetical protein